MKSTIITKIITGVLALSIAISLTACGSSSAMSKEDYQNAVSQIGVDIYALSDSISNINYKDVDETKKALDKSKEAFSKFLEITPPKAYAEAHEKIKAGCEAIINVIEQSSEALETSDETQKKQIEEKINQSLETALYNLIDGSDLMSE